MQRIIATTGQIRTSAQSEPLRTELIRKAIHLLIALVPILASVSVSFTLGLLGAGTLFYIFAEKVRRDGARVIFISDLTLIASRDGDQGRFVLGPVTLGIGAMLALLLYPQEASTIAIYALAFGDSAASLVGKTVGGIRIPFNHSKTIAGSLGCFAVVFAVSLRLTGDIRAAVIIGLATAIFEALPFSDMDNIIIPVGTGFVASGILII